MNVWKEQYARSLVCQPLSGSLNSTIRRTAPPRPPVLASALEGFSPTPEMPEIAKAEALLSRLALGRFGPDFALRGRPL